MAMYKLSSAVPRKYKSPIWALIAWFKACMDIIEVGLHRDRKIESGGEKEKEVKVRVEKCYI